MQPYPKFLFDRSFDVEIPDPAPSADDSKVEEPEEPEIFVPTFSQEEMDAARQAGFEEGRQQGIREAADATERRVADSLDTMLAQFDRVFARQDVINEAATRNGVRVADALVRALFPELNRKGAVDEIMRVAEDVMALIRSQPKVVIRVHEDLREAVEARIGAVASARGYSGRIEILGDAAVALGDCRIDWTGGGAERSCADILNDMEGIIQRNLGPDAPDEPAVPAGNDDEGTET